MCSAESGSEGTSEGSDEDSQNVSAMPLAFSFYSFIILNLLLYFIYLGRCEHPAKMADSRTGLAIS